LLSLFLPSFTMFVPLFFPFLPYSFLNSFISPSYCRSSPSPFSLNFTCELLSPLLRSFYVVLFFMHFPLFYLTPIPFPLIVRAMSIFPFLPTSPLY
jgi:hypothetical protein